MGWTGRVEGSREDCWRRRKERMRREEWYILYISFEYWISVRRGWVGVRVRAISGGYNCTQQIRHHNSSKCIFFSYFLTYNTIMLRFNTFLCSLQWYISVCIMSKYCVMTCVFLCVLTGDPKQDFVGQSHSKFIVGKTLVLSFIVLWSSTATKTDL